MYDVAYTDLYILKIYLKKFGLLVLYVGFIHNSGYVSLHPDILLLLRLLHPGYGEVLVFQCAAAVINTYF
jgi:hypothetical protein